MYYIVPACKRPLDKSVLPLVFGGPKLWDILGTPILRYRYVLLLNPTLLLDDEIVVPAPIQVLPWKSKTQSELVKTELSQNTLLVEVSFAWGPH